MKIDLEEAEEESESDYGMSDSCYKSDNGSDKWL